MTSDDIIGKDDDDTLSVIIAPPDVDALAPSLFTTAIAINGQALSVLKNKQANL
jgi:hypothetical protein